MTPVGCQLAAPNLSTDSHKTLRLTTCGSKAIPRIHLAKLHPELSNIQLFDSQIDNLQQTCGSPERHHDTCRLPTYSPKTPPQNDHETCTLPRCCPKAMQGAHHDMCRLPTYRSDGCLSKDFGMQVGNLQVMVGPFDCFWAVGI